MLIFGFPHLLLASPIIYKIYNKDGSVTFTTRKPLKFEKFAIFNGTKNFSVISSRSVGISRKSGNPPSPEVLRHISMYSKIFNLDKHLIKAIIMAESNFNPTAISPKGAAGLMQLMPETARLVKVSNRFDPEQNIYGGIKYFRHLLDRFNQNVVLALAAYNAGPENVVKYGGVPPFKETQNYVRSVLNLWRQFREASVSG